MFGSFVYYMDLDEVEETKIKKIKSIPEGIWWSIITMATVGYGDVVPRTFFGKLTGACCAIMGILSMSFPVPGRIFIFSILIFRLCQNEIYKRTSNRTLDRT